MNSNRREPPFPMTAGARKISGASGRKIPFIRQAERADCGPACLAMVLRAYGKKVSLAEIKTRLQVGRHGVDAFTLLETAKAFGLTGRGVAASLEALRGLPLPMILHWGGKHYVVLAKLKKSAAEIIDPGLGRVEVSLPLVRQYFSGTALLFQKTKKKEKGPD